MTILTAGIRGLLLPRDAKFGIRATTPVTPIVIMRPVSDSERSRWEGL